METPAEDPAAILQPAPDEMIGDRVVVRGFHESDAPAVYAAIQESVEHLRPWLPWYDSHQSIDDTLAFIRRTQARSLLREGFGLGIFSQEGRFLGGCALHIQDWRVPSFMIGYWIRKSAEGRGYVSEAVRLLTRFAFEELAAERVVIYCDARNARSARVAERLGYVFEGRSRHIRWDTSGELADMVHFALLREEYARLFPPER